MYPRVSGVSATCAMRPVQTSTAGDFWGFTKTIKNLLRLSSSEARVLNGGPVGAKPLLPNATSACFAFAWLLELSGNGKLT